MLRLALRPTIRCKQSLRLSLDQRLKQVLELELKTEGPPDLTKGLEGMQIAHQILQEREATGILIGSLPETIWNQRTKPEDLYKHKDVDVLVLDDRFELEKRFEGGIDWWLPEERTLPRQPNQYSTSRSHERIYRNGCNAVLSFGAEQTSPLSSGLYLPSPEWMVNMREYEMLANIEEPDSITLDTIDKFRRTVAKRMATRLPKFIEEEFAGRILSPEYETKTYKVDAVALKEFM